MNLELLLPVRLALLLTLGSMSACGSVARSSELEVGDVLTISNFQWTQSFGKPGTSTLVVCQENPKVSYKAYVPKSLSTERPARVLVYASPNGNAEPLIKPLAEALGFISIGLTNSKNGNPDDINAATLVAITDIRDKLDLPFYYKWLYVAGFSGGARASSMTAIRFRQDVAGLLCMGASPLIGDREEDGILPDMPIAIEIGDKDPNKKEVDWWIKERGGAFRHKLIVSPHGHTMAPEKAISEAVKWLFENSGETRAPYRAVFRNQLKVVSETVGSIQLPEASKWKVEELIVNGKAIQVVRRAQESQLIFRDGSNPPTIATVKPNRMLATLSEPSVARGNSIFSTLVEGSQRVAFVNGVKANATMILPNPDGTECFDHAKDGIRVYDIRNLESPTKEFNINSSALASGWVRGKVCWIKYDRKTTTTEVYIDNRMERKLIGNYPWNDPNSFPPIYGKIPAVGSTPWSLIRDDQSGWSLAEERIVGPKATVLHMWSMDGNWLRWEKEQRASTIVGKSGKRGASGWIASFDVDPQGKRAAVAGILPDSQLLQVQQGDEVLSEWASLDGSIGDRIKVIAGPDDKLMACIAQRSVQTGARSLIGQPDVIRWAVAYGNYQSRAYTAISHAAVSKEGDLVFVGQRNSRWYLMANGNETGPFEHISAASGSADDWYGVPRKSMAWIALQGNSVVRLTLAGGPVLSKAEKRIHDEVWLKKPQQSLLPTSAFGSGK